jgi:hypothetical protein
MDTATHPNSSPEISLNVELLESSLKRAARRAPEFVDAIFAELFQLDPGAEQAVRGHDHLG